MFSWKYEFNQEEIVIIHPNRTKVSANDCTMDLFSQHVWYIYLMVNEYSENKRASKERFLEVSYLSISQLAEFFIGILLHSDNVQYSCKVSKVQLL